MATKHTVCLVHVPVVGDFNYDEINWEQVLNQKRGIVGSLDLYIETVSMND